jgi:hypothetical protein
MKLRMITETVTDQIQALAQRNSISPRGVKSLCQQSGKDYWKMVLRQWYDDKISLVEGKLTEGIGWDPTLPTDKQNVFGGITVDFAEDHESDVIKFEGPIVHKLADNTYAGFVFREQSLQQKEKAEQDSLFDLAAAIRKLEGGIIKVNKYLGHGRAGRARNEIPDLLPTEFFDEWYQRDEDGRLREHIITKLKGLIGIDHTETLQNIHLVVFLN